MYYYCGIGERVDFIFILFYCRVALIDVYFVGTQYHVVLKWYAM